MEQEKKNRRVLTVLFDLIAGLSDIGSAVAQGSSEPWESSLGVYEGILVFSMTALASILIYQVGFLMVEARTFIRAHICAGVSFLGLLFGVSRLASNTSPALETELSRSWSLLGVAAMVATFIEIESYLSDFFSRPKKRSIPTTVVFSGLLLASGGVVGGGRTFLWIYALLFCAGAVILLSLSADGLLNRPKIRRLSFMEAFGVVLPPIVLATVVGYILLRQLAMVPVNSHLLISIVVFVFLYCLLMSVVFGVLAGEWRMKLIRTNEALELGRSVQDLLVEHSGRSTQDGWDLWVHYEPYLGRMSGDWIMRWETPDGSQHLLFGDVTGKGPQAALAVAMVASIVNSQVRNLASAQTCIDELNKAIFFACNGAVSTTVSGVTYEKDGNIQLFNAGGLGWIVVRQGKCQHWLGRGGILGLADDIVVGNGRFSLGRGDMVIGITDGIASCMRDLRNIGRSVERAIASQREVHDILELVAGRPPVGRIEDDKAMICLRKAA